MRYLLTISLFRNAEKWLAEEVKTFLHEIHQRTGAQLFVLAAFQKTNDSICVTKYVMFYKMLLKLY